MWTTSIAQAAGQAEDFARLRARFEKAFSFLQETDLLALPTGMVIIDQDLVFADVQCYTTMAPEECPFESHRAYFDLQYVAQGEELFQVAPVSELTPSMDYDPQRDLLFYREPARSSQLLLRARDFAIVSPQEGHAPRRMTAGGPCQVKKIVVKVKVGSAGCQGRISGLVKVGLTGWPRSDQQAGQGRISRLAKGPL